jgi:hypothetical protein
LAPREWFRTTDLAVNSRALYQLSYLGTEKVACRKRVNGPYPEQSAGWLRNAGIRLSGGAERLGRSNPLVRVAVLKVRLLHEAYRVADLGCSVGLSAIRLGSARQPLSRAAPSFEPSEQPEHHHCEQHKQGLDPLPRRVPGDHEQPLRVTAADKGYAR